MTYELHTLDQRALADRIKALIIAEQDLTRPRHITLIKMFNELSVTGFPLLVDVARALLDQRIAWMSAPLRSALERVCSGVEGAGPKVERRFDTPEEKHLINQLQTLMSDLERLLLVSDDDELTRLRKLLWIGATRHLMTRAEERHDSRLRLLLVYASGELGETLLVDAALFEELACDILAERLRSCHVGGGTLSLTLPGESDVPQIKQLKESRIALDLRGVERLKLEGYGVLEWLDAVEQGLDEVSVIEPRMLRDHEVEGLEARGIMERVAAGWSAPLIIDQAHDETRDETRDEARDEAHEISLRMVRCPAGEFWMGDHFAVDDYDKEFARHRVVITHPFLISQSLVTRAQWFAVMKSMPVIKRSRLRSEPELDPLLDPDLNPQINPDHPITGITWNDCARFCNALSDQMGLEPVYTIGEGRRPEVKLDLDRSGYRLPIEAEWEYMAKAGVELPFVDADQCSRDLSDYDRAWCDAQDEHPHPAQSWGRGGQNSWGIYDSQEYWEHCSDNWVLHHDTFTQAPRYDPHVNFSAQTAHVNRSGAWSDGLKNREVFCRDKLGYTLRGGALRVLRRCT